MVLRLFYQIQGSLAAMLTSQTSLVTGFKRPKIDCRDNAGVFEVVDKLLLPGFEKMESRVDPIDRFDVGQA